MNNWISSFTSRLRKSKISMWSIHYIYLNIFRDMQKRIIETTYLQLKSGAMSCNSKLHFHVLLFSQWGLGLLYLFVNDEVIEKLVLLCRTLVYELFRVCGIELVRSSTCDVVNYVVIRLYILISWISGFCLFSKVVIGFYLRTFNKKHCWSNGWLGC